MIVPDASSLIPIATGTLRANMAFPFDLFLLTGDERRPLLYREKRLPMHDNDLAGLKRRDVTTLYISFNDVAEYEQYLRSTVLGNSSATPAARLAAVRDANRSMFEAVTRNNQVGEIAQFASNIGQQITELVMSEDATAKDLIQVLQHDYYTYTHISNVCTYALLLAKHVGISNPQEMHSIATGALLHDMGKRLVPATILNKPDRLNDDEARIVKRHPTTGFLDLSTRPEMSFGLLMMVYQHHERIDGNGYPVRVTGEEIHDWAKICAIVDVFDAFTCCRPYRGAVHVDDVMAFITKNSGTSFDEELVRCWTHLLTSKG